MCRKQLRGQAYLPCVVEVIRGRKLDCRWFCRHCNRKVQQVCEGRGSHPVDRFLPGRLDSNQRPPAPKAFSMNWLKWLVCNTLYFQELRIVS
jgi:hypothetical protein